MYALRQYVENQHWHCNHKQSYISTQPPPNGIGYKGQSKPILSLLKYLSFSSSSTVVQSKLHPHSQLLKHHTHHNSSCLSSIVLVFSYCRFHAYNIVSLFASNFELVKKTPVECIRLAIFIQKSFQMGTLRYIA
jgi:hypothetical protein